MVSHVSSSVPKRQLPTYLSIDEMIRTRGSQQNSGEPLRCQVIAIPAFAEQDWLAAISPIKLTAVSKDASSNHSNTSDTALSRRSIGSRFNPESTRSAVIHKAHGRARLAQSREGDLTMPAGHCPPLLRPLGIIFA